MRGEPRMLFCIVSFKLHGRFSKFESRREHSWMNLLRMSSKSVRWAFNWSKWNPTPAELMLASSCIQPDEKERIAKFVFKKDFKASLIGRLLMRKYVSEVTGDGYKDIHLIREANHRPVVAKEEFRSIVNFSVSHQGDYTVLAGEFGNVKLGTDIMKLEYTGGKPLSEFFRIMNRQFNPSEWDTIRRAGDEKQQTAMFCRYWCLKESYGKAIGVGVAMNFQDLCFEVHTKDLSTESIVTDTEAYVRGEKLNWKFHESLLDEEHCIAVALNDPDWGQTMFKELNFDELMGNSEPLLESDEEFCRKYFTKLERPN